MKLYKILETAVPGLGYELVDIELTPAKLVRVFIDKADGAGVTIQDCEIVSNHLSKLLLVEEIDYNRLEVSSPGVERPLKKIEDYTRFTGRYAKIKSKEIIGDQKVFQGLIVGVNGRTITLKLENNSNFEIDFDDIYKSKLIFEPKNKSHTSLKNKLQGSMKRKYK